MRESYWLESPSPTCCTSARCTMPHHHHQHHQQQQQLSHIQQLSLRSRHVSSGTGIQPSRSHTARSRHASGGAMIRRCPLSCRDLRRCCSSKANEVVKTDVVVIGNGPSGICLSLILSGHWPYFTGEAHSDESLTSRLYELGAKTSLVEQDLKFLSDGLEGRSSNPVALLFDALANPDADLGQDLPSLMRWEYDATKAVPHVVLGKREEGGVWQTMEGQMQTLSLGTWMQLPGMSFKEWIERDRSESNGASSADGLVMKPTYALPSNRATMEEVRRYYTDFVDAKGLRKYFYNNTTVTSVQRIPGSAASSLRRGFGSDIWGPCADGGAIDSESGEQVGCDDMNWTDGSDPMLWVVSGYHTAYDDMTGEPRTSEFCYLAKSVVLATGAFDCPNQLSVPGETIHPYVLHSLAELEEKCSILEAEGRGLNADSDPVVVVGAGLSAADAVLNLARMSVPVVHVFRRGPVMKGQDSKSRGVTGGGLAAYRQLPPNIYPEYAAVHRMMLGEEVELDGLLHGEAGTADGSPSNVVVDRTGLYRPFPGADVLEFTANNEVLLRCNRSGGETVVKASFVVVLIGARPDLSFLPAEVLGSLGVTPGASIESKHNPVDVDPWTYESGRFPGLYAMGPLVGDNFVRFLQGGALGIAAHIVQRRAESAAPAVQLHEEEKVHEDMYTREECTAVARKGRGDGKRSFKELLRLNSLRKK